MMERRKVEQSQKAPLSRKMPMKTSTKSSFLKPSSALLVAVNPRPQPPPIALNKKESLPRIAPLPKTPTGKIPTPVKLTPLHSPLNKQRPRNLTPGKPNISINSKIIQHIHIGGNKLDESKTVIAKQEEDTVETLSKERRRLAAKLKETEARQNKEREEWKSETLKAKIWLEQLLTIAGDKVNKHLKEGIKKFVYKDEIEPERPQTAINRTASEKFVTLGKIDETSEIDQGSEAEVYKKFIEYKSSAKAMVMPTFMKSLSSENGQF